MHVSYSEFVPRSENVRYPTQEQVNEFEERGFMTCPECKKPMKHIKSPNQKTDECYCERNHLSIVLFKRGVLCESE